MPDNIRMVTQGKSYYDTDSGQNAVQVLTVDATAGTFTVSHGGTTTAAIAEAATAATLQTALEGLASIGTGNVAVTGAAGGPWTITFINGKAKKPMATLTTSATGLSGTGALTAVVTVSAVGFSGVNLSWGTGGSATREIVAAPAASRSLKLQEAITKGLIEETATAVTVAPTYHGHDRVKLSRKLAIPPTNGDILTYNGTTKLWVPEANK